MIKLINCISKNVYICLGQSPLHMVINIIEFIRIANFDMDCLLKWFYIIIIQTLVDIYFSKASGHPEVVRCF